MLTSKNEENQNRGIGDNCALLQSTDGFLYSMFRDLIKNLSKSGFLMKAV